MMFILGMLLGTIIGMFLVALISVDKINQYEEDLNTQIMLRKNRDKFIEKSMKTNLELKNKIEKQKEEIVDLKNNIEFLFNNLSAQKKKLVKGE